MTNYYVIETYKIKSVHQIPFPIDIQTVCHPYSSQLLYYNQNVPLIYFSVSFGRDLLIGHYDQQFQELPPVRVSQFVLFLGIYAVSLHVTHFPLIMTGTCRPVFASDTLEIPFGVFD